MKKLSCLECGSIVFQYVTGVNPNSIDSSVDEILQCGHCGRYKFLSKQEVK